MYLQYSIIIIIINVHFLFILIGEAMKQKYTIVELTNYVFNTYISNIVHCQPGDMALEEL